MLRHAIERANQRAWLATDTGNPAPLDSAFNQPAISLDARFGPLRPDEQRPAPIYNYSRVVSWSLSVDRIYTAFSAASYRAAHRIPVAAHIPWEKSARDSVHPLNRRGRPDQVAGYIQRIPHASALSSNIHVGRRELQSSFMALLLTWGTIGSAILLDWFTPTIGICQPLIQVDLKANGCTRLGVQIWELPDLRRDLHSGLGYADGVNALELSADHVTQNRKPPHTLRQMCHRH
jgi:hypothetical protein